MISPCFIMTCRNLMTTFELGRSRTCLLPLFSALCMVLRASCITLTRTMAAGRYHNLQVETAGSNPSITGINGRLRRAQVSWQLSEASYRFMPTRPLGRQSNSRQLAPSTRPLLAPDAADGLLVAELDAFLGSSRITLQAYSVGTAVLPSTGCGCRCGKVFHLILRRQTP